MYQLSTNTFKLLIHRESSKSKTCTVISLSSGKIYRCPASQIFDSKKGRVKQLRGLASVEKSIYYLILEGKLGKNVSQKTYEKMIKKLKCIDSYAKK